MERSGHGRKRIGVVDTMFARIDMGGIVLAALGESRAAARCGKRSAARCRGSKIWVLPRNC